MSFDATKSKLFPQIMAAMVSFFSLGTDATETEIHNALDGSEPLKAQLEAARLEAESRQADEMKKIQDRLSVLEAAQEKTDAEMKVKDERIAELQTEIAGHETTANAGTAAIAAIKEQHQKEIKVLAGQVSALKAGRTLEQDEDGGDAHNADTNPPNDSKVAAVVSDELKEMMQKRRNN